jgi:hypothetical protein
LYTQIRLNNMINKYSSQKMHSVFLNRKILIKKNRKNILVIEIKEDLSYVQTIWQIIFVTKNY